MIIVAGMDNTGKTTLVEELSKKLLMKKVKSPGPISKDDQALWMLSQITNDVNEEKIYDRFPIFEEVVYGKTLRGKSNFELGGTYFNQVKDLEPLIIYARPLKEDIFNFGDREQMRGVISQKEALLAAYDELMFQLMADRWKVVIHNYKVNTVEEIEIIHTIKTLWGGSKR